MNSNDIVALLKKKHHQDVVVEECVAHQGQVRMDLWVMPKSWAKPWITVYEIKVSRPDFLRDDKWPQYLPYCNQFAFVCPWGLIDKKEIPEGAGLMWAPKVSGTRLVTKLKPPLRRQVIRDEVFRAILMSRATIGPSNLGINHRESELKRWQYWMEQKRDKRKFGHDVSKEISRLAGERILEIENKNRYVHHELRRYEEIRQLIEELPEGMRSASDLKLKLEGVPTIEVRDAAQRTIRAMEHLLSHVRATEERSKDRLIRIKEQPPARPPNFQKNEKPK